MPATAPQATAANVNRIAQVGYPVRAASACAPRTTRLPKMFIRPHAVFVSPDLERAIGLVKAGLRTSLRLTDLAQHSRTLRAVRNLRPISGARRRSPSAS